VSATSTSITTVAVPSSLPVTRLGRLSVAVKIEVVTTVVSQAALRERVVHHHHHHRVTVVSATSTSITTVAVPSSLPVTRLGRLSVAVKIEVATTVVSQAAIRKRVVPHPQPKTVVSATSTSTMVPVVPSSLSATRLGRLSVRVKIEVATTVVSQAALLERVVPHPQPKTVVSAASTSTMVPVVPSTKPATRLSQMSVAVKIEVVTTVDSQAPLRERVVPHPQPKTVVRVD